jgi:hypothetical protein
VLAIAIVGGFLTVALTFPELLPWYSDPSPHTRVHLLGTVGGINRE